MAASVATRSAMATTMRPPLRTAEALREEHTEREHKDHHKDDGSFS